MRAEAPEQYNPMLDMIAAAGRRLRVDLQQGDWPILLRIKGGITTSTQSIGMTVDEAMSLLSSLEEAVWVAVGEPAEVWIEGDGQGGWRSGSRGAD